MSEASLKREIKKLKDCMRDKDYRIRSLERFERSIKELKGICILILWTSFCIFLTYVNYLYHVRIWEKLGIAWVYSVNEKINGITEFESSVVLFLSFWIITGVIWHIWFRVMDGHK